MRSSLTTLHLRCRKSREELYSKKNYQSPTLPQKNCTYTELALCTPRYHKLWRQNILRPFLQAQRNLCSIRPSKTKMTPARKRSKIWFISSRRIQIEKRCKPTWSKITRSTHSASSRREWSAAWETRSTSRLAKSLEKYSATTVWHTGREALCLRPSDKTKNKTKIATMFCRFPTSSSRKAHLTVHVTETQRGKDSTMQLASHPKRQRKRVTIPYWTDSWVAFVIETDKSTSDGTKNNTHAWMQLRPKIIPKSPQLQSVSDVNMLGCLCSTVPVRAARWTNVKTTTKPSKSKSDHMKSLVKVTQDFIPVSNFNNDQVNQSPGTMKELSVSTQRLAGVRRGGRHQVGMNSDFSFNPRVKVFRLQAMAIPLKATEGVTTTPNPRTLRTPTHVIFLAWLKTWAIESTRIVVSHKTVVLHIWYRMSHAPSLLFPLHLGTTLLSTCTPVQPSTRPTTRPSLLSTSRGDLPCADPSSVCFGHLA